MNQRNNDTYVKEELRKALRRELAHVEERKKMEMEAKQMFGDEMYHKLMGVNAAREDALCSGYIHISVLK